MKALIAILLGLLLIGSVCVVAEPTPVDTSKYPDNYIVNTFHLSNGWNLIPYGEGIDIDFDNMDDDDIRAAYVWDQLNGKYVDMLDNNMEYRLRDLIDRYKYTAVWVYIDVDNAELEVRMDADEVQMDLKEANFEFERGWNFYVILPQMFKDYSGDFLNMYPEAMVNGRVYAWDRDEWESAYFTEEITNGSYQEEMAGMPILLYYNYKVTPKLEAVQVAPPDFPTY